MTESTTVTKPDVAAIREALARTQGEFQALLASLAPGDWRRKAAASAWSVGELIAHLTWSVEQLPREITAARRGNGMFNMPAWLRDPLSLIYTRWLARGYDPQSAAQRYAAAIMAVDALLDTVGDDDWQRGARFYGERFYSVADLCQTPSQHLAEHQLTIKRMLGKNQGT
ncbi:MAG TPA: DinB family protein [Chloroflexota bacterium]|jgi:hypothetical protein